jgi:hypothetical protein
VILHPTSVFGSEAKQITLTDLLAYVSLLETNKPYAVNVTRCPALHTLLLFANTSTLLRIHQVLNVRCVTERKLNCLCACVCVQVDTTADCARLAVDNWLEIELNSGQYALSPSSSLPYLNADLGFVCVRACV